MFSSASTYLAIASLVALTAAAQAQFSRLHVGNVSAGGTGQFSRILTPINTTIAPNANSITLRQDTTWSAGLITSLQMHPLSFVGIQLNYGYTRYQERYTTAFRNSAATTVTSIPTDAHEATAGYLLHPKYIPFKPYLAVGGGAIDFNPRGGVTATSPTVGSHQWRGAGYLETGFDLPTRNKHIGFRISGRSLYYRSPDFRSPALSTSSWRATVEPSASVVYKF
jgi:hypothetical protein